MCCKQMMPELGAKIKSPYRRTRTVRELSKPRLSRRITLTARVNLNSHWSSFEELSNESSGRQLPSTHQYDEIHDNLINELAELYRK